MGQIWIRCAVSVSGEVPPRAVRLASEGAEQWQQDQHGGRGTSSLTGQQRQQRFQLCVDLGAPVAGWALAYRGFWEWQGLVHLIKFIDWLSWCIKSLLLADLLHQLQAVLIIFKQGPSFSKTKQFLRFLLETIWNLIFQTVIFKEGMAKHSLLLLVHDIPPHGSTLPWGTWM